LNLFITKSDIGRQEADVGYDYHKYLLHEAEPIDSHQKYRDDDFTPKVGGNNLQNLFYDSDTKNSSWFSIARKFLRNY
jgi:hypothetical protein